MASAEPDAAAGLIDVELAWSLQSGAAVRIALRLPAGSTAAAALRQAGMLQRLGAETLDSLQLALWGRAVSADAVLQQHDRLELLRPLQVDPKEARRLRLRRDGIRPRRKAPRR